MVTGGAFGLDYSLFLWVLRGGVSGRVFGLDTSESLGVLRREVLCTVAELVPFSLSWCLSPCLPVDEKRSTAKRVCRPHYLERCEERYPITFRFRPL